MNIPDWLHAELLNWSRWCWQGDWPHPLPPRSCASIERNYRRTAEDATADEARPIPPFEPAARRVDIAWRRLPHLERRVIRLEYPQRHLYESRREAAIALGLSVRQYREALQRAFGELWKGLECGTAGK